MKRWMAAALLAATGAGCGRDKEAERQAAPRPVMTAAVERIEANQVGPFAGKIEARFRTNLGFQIAGRVVERDAVVGQTVQAGAILARLDPTQERLNLARADADVADGEAQAANAIEEFNRKQVLVQQNVDPQAVVDRAKANRDTSTARSDALKATQRKARESLTYTDLKAEFDGVVTTWQTEVGNQVQAGQAVVEMVRPDVREAAVDMPADIVRDLPKDAVFTVALEGDPTQSVEAHVRELGPLADAQTRTQRLRLSLASTPDAFRIGSTVLVSVRQAVAPHLRLPEAAVLDQNGEAAVWVVVDGKTVDRRAIQVTERRDGRVTATGDLPAEARVVVAGIHSLQAGQAVRLRRDR